MIMTTAKHNEKKTNNSDEHLNLRGVLTLNKITKYGAIKQ